MSPPDDNPPLDYQYVALTQDFRLAIFSQSEAVFTYLGQKARLRSGRSS